MILEPKLYMQSFCPSPLQDVTNSPNRRVSSVTGCKSYQRYDSELSPALCTDMLWSSHGHEGLHARGWKDWRWAWQLIAIYCTGQESAKLRHTFPRALCFTVHATRRALPNRQATCHVVFRVLCHQSTLKVKNIACSIYDSTNAWRDVFWF
jgi:hypothetical protein